MAANQVVAERKTAHSPLPWGFADDSLSICRLIVTVEDVECVRIYPTTDPDRAIAYVPTEYAEVEQRANVQRIVQAVNAHDELVAALKHVEEYADVYDISNRLLRIIRDALKKAGH